MTFLLIDSSVPPQRIDLEYAARLAERRVPFALAFTKVDKRKKGGPTNGRNITAFKRALLAEGFAAVPPSVVTSAEDGTGKSEMLALIASLRIAFNAAGGAEAAVALAASQQQPQPALA